MSDDAAGAMAGTKDVLVIGAGVIGLTTAVVLAESGLDVVVRTATPPSRTASACAGAIWTMSFVEMNDDVVRWGRTALTEFVALAADPASGVRLVDGVEASRLRPDISASAALLQQIESGGARVCDDGDLPAGFIGGARFSVPLIDMPAYLDYLYARLRSAGGRLVVEPVDRLDDVAGAARTVLNCAGTGAGRLAGDWRVGAVRGQLVVAENPGITEFFAEDDDGEELLYVLPHGDRIVLGGTAETGRWDLAPDPAAARRIVQRCVDVLPALRSAKIVEHRVGLRPTRASVRCEIERRADGGWLGHCYGHGGAGVSLSWGCAHELFDQLASRW
jgi:D-amino-acid oxidase